MTEWFDEWFDEDYALLYAHRDADEARMATALALRLAPELATGPVLDLGCGSGRHLVCLRQTNPLAFGMDLSRPLLALAARPLQPWLLRGDMRALPVKPGTLSGLCLWFTPFGYFPDAQNQALLQAIARLLKPGGILLMDYLNADLVTRTLVSEDTIERTGIRVRSRRTLEGTRLVKRMTLTRLATGQTREAMESVRLYHPADLQDLAAQAGLHFREAVGTYAGDAFQPDSPRWIGVFAKGC